ncbi:MAG TPA: hypothetical protein VN622_05545, partial [Clostridia bacterium]|nr:hypothetical protein [Clostridia bacterium]
MTDAHSNRNISIKLVLVFFTIILLAGLFPALAGAAVINPDEKPAINTYFLLENPYDTDRSGTTYNKNGFVSNPIIPLRKVEAAPFSIKALAAEYGHAGMFSAEFVDATESVSAAHVLIQAIMDYHAARGTTIDPFDPAYIGWNTDGTITSVMGVTIAAESRPSPALNFDAMKVQVIPEGITPPDNWISGSASNIASVGNIAANSVVKLTRIAPTVANPDKERIFASSAAEITQTIDEPLKIYTRTIMWSTLSGSYALKTSYGTAVYTAKIYCYNPFNQTYTDVTSDPSFIAATHGEPNITTGNGSYYEITFAANGQYIVALQLTNTSTYYSMTSYTMVNFSGKAASVDLTALESAIANAQSKTPDNYYPANDRWNGTDTSANGFYADMQTALAAAQLALNSPDQQVIDNAAAALNTAAGKLIPKTKVNATVLHETLQANGSIDTAAYTAESAANYGTARDAAQTLYAGGAVAQTVYSEGAQADIEDKAAALNAAAADLLTNTEVEAAEKVRANLNALLALVAGFDQSAYTPASWTLLTSAKAEAEAVKDIAVTTKAQAAAVTLPYNNLWDVYLHKLVDADGVVHVSLRVEGAAGRYGTLYLNDSMSVSVKSAEDMRTKYYDTDNLTPSATPNVMHLIAAMWDETGIPTPYYGSNKPITFKQTDGFIGKLFDSSGAEALIGYRSHIYINGVLIDPSVSDTELYAALHEGDAVVLASYPVQDENGIYNQQRYYARFTGDAITDGAVTVATGEAFSLTAEAKDGFDLSGSYAPIKGLQIFVSEAGALGATKATGIKTGNNGSFSYTFTQPGDYVVEAYLSDQTAKASTVPARVVVHVTGTDYGEITTVIDPIVNNIASYFTTTWTMGAGTLGGDWTNIGMQVYGRTLLTSEAELNEFAVLSVAQLRTNVVWTDYARIGLALSSLGFDVSDLDQYNLDFKDHSGNPVHSLIDGLVNFDNDYTLNGPVYALLLLDSKDYEIPAGAKWTRDALVEAVLEYRGANGAFSLTNRLNGKGSANDTDLTAMALQALAPYRSRADVAAAAGKAVTWLSSVQWESGGFQASQYTGTAGVTSESTAQVIMALCALGIDPVADARFIKSGQEAPFGTFAPHSAIAGLLDFITPDGAGFAHSRDTQNLYGDQRDKNEFNSMATDQGFLALLAYQNFVRNGGQPTCVYDFGALNAGAADKTNLAKMLEIARQITDEGYTAASWTDFQQAVNRASAVNDNAAARQKQVDAAWIELTNALASLTPRLTNAQLSAIIAVLETETSFPAGDYDDRDLDGGIGFGTYYNYLTALDAAKTVAASENASEAEINAALDGIETAINGLRVWPSDTDISVMGMLAPGADRYFDGDHIYEFFSDTGMEGQGISGAGSVGVYGLLHPDPSTVYSKEVNVIKTITAYKNGTRGLVFKDDAEALAVLTDTTQTTGAYYFSLTQMIARAESLGADTRYTQATREALAAAATQAGEILGAYLAGQSAPGDGDEETTPGDGDEETTPGDGDEETTPGDSDEETTPGDSDEETTPGDGDEETAPGDGDEETTPGDGETTLGAAQIAAADTEPLDAEETTPSAAQVAAAGTELLYALNNLEYDKTDLQVLISEAQA